MSTPRSGHNRSIVLLDGGLPQRVTHSPAYPMQFMLNVYELRPSDAAARDAGRPFPRLPPQLVAKASRVTYYGGQHTARQTRDDLSGDIAAGAEQEMARVEDVRSTYAAAPASTTALRRD